MNGLITARWQLLPAALALWAGCIVDSDNPCRENEIKLEGDIAGCLCAPGAVPNADGSGCVLCGANEVVKSGKCECDVGFARAGDGSCLRSELGAACGATMACGSEFPFCAPGGYCTKQGCTSSSECVGSGYWCDTSTSPSVCTRPPTGLGKSCMTSADCAGQEANTCAQMTCAVGGCATTVKCFADTVCCDFTAFGIGDICIPPTSLAAGKCPGTMADPVVRP